MVAGLIQALIALNNEAYVPERWHQTLLTIAIISSSIIFNTVLAVKLPLIEGKSIPPPVAMTVESLTRRFAGIILILHLCGVFAIIIPLWVLAPRTPTRIALLDYTNIGGWDTQGLAAVIGMVTPLNVLIGYDCSVHMCKSRWLGSKLAEPCMNMHLTAV